VFVSLSVCLSVLGTCESAVYVRIKYRIESAVYTAEH